ncbi:M15 family metallopeptidase [Microbacterium sp. CJ88]|uniref:M15 family metallopeptidase n=1 Tax=Microbacterium sp. CJ88 TaxID=3445672 RepID=UPI003F65A6DE
MTDPEPHRTTLSTTRTRRIVVPVVAATRTAPPRDTDAPLLDPPSTRRNRGRLLVTGLVAAVLVLGSATAVTTAVTAGALAGAPASGDAALAAPPQAAAAPAQAIPAPTMIGPDAPADACAAAPVATALAAGDDAAVIAAVGGVESFRTLVTAGTTACLSLGDPGRIWTVVNKLRPYTPTDYAPAALRLPDPVRSLAGEQLRADAATALAALGQAAVAEGAGTIAMESGYRSYATQKRNFGAGGPEVEASVARPGYSEHQSGLAADVVPCTSRGCGTMDDLAASPQGAWVAANAWRFGWIVRYEPGRTPTTGYIPEAWHLRYIGTDLAAAYHDEGWHTLEEFFGLPAAPTY